MEWVFNDKLNQVGTAPGAVSAEVVAERRLCALRARQARREQRMGAAEDRLLRYSRWATGTWPRWRGPAMLPGCVDAIDACLRACRPACAGSACARSHVCAFADSIRREREGVRAGRSPAMHGCQEPRVQEQVDSERSLELARLAAFLGETAGEAEERSAPPAPTAAATLAEGAEGGAATPRPPAEGDRRTRLETLYQGGVAKQQARNCSAPSRLEQVVGMELSCRLALTLTLSGGAAQRVAEEGRGRNGPTVTPAVTHVSDTRSHTHSRPPWAGTGGVPSAREAEHGRALREEIAVANSRRYMLQERTPPACIPLPKAACALGGADPPLSTVRGGVLVAGWAAQDSGGRRWSEGGEARGREAWGRGVAVNQGGLWRYQGTAQHPNAPSRRTAQTQPARVRRMLSKDEVEHMSADDMEALVRALTLPRGSATRHNELVALGHADLDLDDGAFLDAAARHAHPLPATRPASSPPATPAPPAVEGKGVKGAPARLQRHKAVKQLINMWSIEAPE